MIEIKNRFTSEVIASGQTIQDAINNCLKDLRNAYLEGAYLDGADLRGANLRGAYLRNADLEGAYLRNADLRGADLEGAYLRGAYLRNADLRGADLRGAYLRGAILRGAYLRGADLINIKINWMSHDLIAEILRQSAEDNIQKRSLAGLISVSKDWCWDDFLKLDITEKEWAMDVLSKYSTDDNPMPTGGKS